MASQLRPLSLRRVVLVGVAAVSLFALSGCLSPTQSQVQSELNADRGAQRLRTLSIQPDAQTKAQAWAEKLARENKLYHSNLSDGIRARWCGLAENVGYGANVPVIEDAYMNSAGHRANILSTTWNGVGVGYAKNGNRVFTVQVFIKTC